MDMSPYLKINLVNLLTVAMFLSMAQVTHNQTILYFPSIKFGMRRALVGIAEVYYSLFRILMMEGAIKSMATLYRSNAKPNFHTKRTNLWGLTCGASKI
jgi:hypothetical protein